MGQCLQSLIHKCATGAYCDFNVEHLYGMLYMVEVFLLLFHQIF